MLVVQRRLGAIGFQKLQYFHLILLIRTNLWKIIAPDSNLPYLFKAMPITYVNEKEVADEPYNNLKNYEILLKGIEKCDKESIIVFDSHYMTLEGELY